MFYRAIGGWDEESAISGRRKRTVWQGLTAEKARQTARRKARRAAESDETDPFSGRRPRLDHHISSARGRCDEAATGDRSRRDRAKERAERERRSAHQSLLARPIDSQGNFLKMCIAKVEKKGLPVV